MKDGIIAAAFSLLASAWLLLLWAPAMIAIAAFRALPAAGAVIEGSQQYFGSDRTGAGLFAAGYAVQPVFSVGTWGGPAIGTLALVAYSRLRGCARSTGWHTAATMALAIALLPTIAASAVALPLDLAVAEWRRAVLANDGSAADLARGSLLEFHQTAERVHAVAGITALIGVAFASGILVRCRPSGASAAGDCAADRE